jgi:glycerol-3-phosphate acyltransferase PlsY
MDGRILAAVVVMSGLLVWRHAENMSRLVKGTESRLGKKKT